MSAEKKTITINPELFKVSSSKTRKQRPNIDEEGGGAAKLRIRGDTPKRNKRDITTKHQVLKYIRQKQEERRQSRLEKEAQGKRGGDPILPKNTLLETQDKFDSDFNQSLDFLHHLAEKTKHKIAQGGATMKTRAPTSAEGNTQSSVLYNGGVLNDILEHNIEVAPPQTGENTMAFTQSPFQARPHYGCLKGGVLPTYRNWKQTMKHHSGMTSPHPPIQNRIHSPPVLQSSPLIRGGVFPEMVASPPEAMSVSQPVGGQPDAVVQGETETAQRIQNLRNKFHSPEWMKKKREMRSFQQKKDEVIARGGKPKIKRMKQKKTMRRTYRVGKSKHYPRVSVLVSNRTIRKQITEKSQKLKQIPIEEVRKTLIKKGFIKVGSIAPNDVLRKMYETISLLCGDVQNHNADNLVYNYFHSNHE